MVLRCDTDVVERVGLAAFSLTQFMGYLEEAENHWLVHIRITAQNIQKALEHNGILKNGVRSDVL